MSRETCFSNPYTLSRGVRRWSSNASSATASTLANLVLISARIWRIDRKVKPCGGRQGGSQALHDAALQHSFGLVPKLVTVVGMFGDSDGVCCHSGNDRHVSGSRRTTSDPDRSVRRHRSVGGVSGPFGVIEDMGEETSGRNRGGQA